MPQSKDPEKAFRVLETLLHGIPLAVCGKKFKISDERCRQLAVKAAYDLRRFPYVSPEAMLPHDIAKLRERYRRRDFWLRQIVYARSLNIHTLTKRETRELLKPLGVAYGLETSDIHSLLDQYHRRMLTMARQSKTVVNG